MTSFNRVFTAKTTHTICFSNCFIFYQIMVTIYPGQRIAPKIWNDPSRSSKTFEDYATLDVIPTIRAYSIKYERTDIVFDVYRPSSLKAEARSKRGHGARRRVTSRCKVPSNWCNFLRDNNKTDLFNFLADKIEQMPSPNNSDRDQRRECTQQPQWSA